MGYFFLFIVVFAGCFAAAVGGDFLLRRAVLRGVRAGKGKPWLRFPGHRKLRLGAVATLVFLSTGLSWLLTGHPVLGLPALLLVPRAFAEAVRWGARRNTAALDRTAVGFLHALHGQIRTGASLPLALFRLAGDFDTPFARSLAKFLQRYERGEPLKACLERFRDDADLGLSASFLTLLELSYRRGLAVAPLLENVLPLLEAELETEERLRSLRQSALAQGATAAVLPWVLGGVLGAMQPGVGAGAGGHVYLALLLEGAGGYCLWRASQFY